MSRRDVHLAEEQFERLALTVGDHDEVEESALAHVSSCDACSWRLAEVTARLAETRRAARDEADACFGDEVLERQRRRILSRVARLGEPARVLPFPGTAERAAGLPAKTRLRWVSVAAAAGLIVGLLAGQGLHLLPSGSRWQTAAAQRTSLDAVSQARLRPATAGVTDDDLLDAVDAALQLHRGQELTALDALTPAVVEGR